MGERQIFVRLAGCPWRCRYCDTPDSLSTEGHKSMSVEDVLDEVHHLQEEKEHRTVSLTGGEPLVQADFLQALLPALQRLDRRTYLETSGTHPHLLKRVIDHCDVVAMDIKLPSAIGREFWAEHEEFLKIAGDKAFVKLVLTAQSGEEEVARVIQLLAGLDPIPPLVFQPVTAISDLEARLKKETGPDGRPPAPHRLVSWWETARQKLPHVKVISQMHPIWGMP